MADRDATRHHRRLLTPSDSTFDLANAHTVEAELRTVKATDVSRIVLDLSGLAFINSTGVRLIIAANARSRIDGNRFQLRSGPPQVQGILELTATTDPLPFTD